MKITLSTKTSPHAEIQVVTQADIMSAVARAPTALMLMLTLYAQNTSERESTRVRTGPWRTLSSWSFPPASTRRTGAAPWRRAPCHSAPPGQAWGNTEGNVDG